MQGGKCTQTSGHCDWAAVASVQEGTSRQQHTPKIISELHLNENDEVM